MVTSRTTWLSSFVDVISKCWLLKRHSVSSVPVGELFVAELSFARPFQVGWSEITSQSTAISCARNNARWRVTGILLAPRPQRRFFLFRFQCFVSSGGCQSPLLPLIGNSFWCDNSRHKSGYYLTHDLRKEIKSVARLNVIALNVNCGLHIHSTFTSGWIMLSLTAITIYSAFANSMKERDIINE